MNEKKELKGVSDTLFIPLAARIEVSKRFPDYFYDSKSVELSDHDAVCSITANSSEYSMLASVARYYNMDKMATDFIQKYKKCTIINLGVGLETMNYRIKNENVRFYSVDFPDVIESRQSLLGSSDNETMIGCDITDLSWTTKIDGSVPILMIVSGVFQYFQPRAVYSLVTALKNIFPEAEMVFDATDEVGINYARKYVKKTGNTNAMMYFYINDPHDFTRKVGVELLDVRNFYDDARKLLKKRVGLYTRIAMKVADNKGRTKLLHIRFPSK